MRSLTLPTVTLRRPWAPLVLNGIKTLETRSQPILRRYVGQWVGIHCAKRSPGWEEAMDEVDGLVPGPSTIAPARWGTADGCVCGVARVVDVWRADNSNRVYHLRWEREALVPIEGLWLARLADATWLRYPVPARGRLGVWTAEIPADALPVEVSCGA